MSTADRRPNLEALRVAAGWTRAELAAKIASRRDGHETVHERTILRWETGATPIPSDYWPELAGLFGVSVAHLLGLDQGAG